MPRFLLELILAFRPSKWIVCTVVYNYLVTILARHTAITLYLATCPWKRTVRQVPKQIQTAMEWGQTIQVMTVPLS